MVLQVGQRNHGQREGSQRGQGYSQGLSANASRRCFPKSSILLSEELRAERMFLELSELGMGSALKPENHDSFLPGIAI